MKIAHLCAMSILMLAAGCAVPPVKPYPVSPELKVNGGSAGKGHEVLLEVTYKRSDSLREFPIEGDFAAIVRNSVSQGLQSEGFTIDSAKSAGAHELRIKILALRHEYNLGWIIPYHQESVRFALKSACVVANDVQLEKDYSSQSDWTFGFLHYLTRAELEQEISRTVSISINQMLNDDQLRQCLIEPKQLPGAAAALSQVPKNP